MSPHRPRPRLARLEDPGRGSSPAAGTFANRARTHQRLQRGQGKIRRHGSSAAPLSPRTGARCHSRAAAAAPRDRDAAAIIKQPEAPAARHCDARRRRRPPNRRNSPRPPRLKGRPAAAAAARQRRRRGGASQCGSAGGPAAAPAPCPARARRDRAPKHDEPARAAWRREAYKAQQGRNRPQQHATSRNTMQQDATRPPLTRRDLRGACGLAAAGGPAGDAAWPAGWPFPGAAAAALRLRAGPYHRRRMPGVCGRRGGRT